MSSTLRQARRVSFGLAAAAVALLLGAGQASASSGTGTVTDGYEVPSLHVTFAQGVTCATFHREDTQMNDDPTIHTLPMSGSLVTHGTSSGTATFTITSDWHASPDGTYLNANCSTAGPVPGTLSISFNGWTCTGSANYLRENETDYYLDASSLTCVKSGQSNVIIEVHFEGTQVLCDLDCNDPNAGTNLDADYTWAVV